MEQTMEGLLFYLRWLLVNGFIFYAESGFLLGFSASRVSKRFFRCFYIAANCALIFFAIYFQLSSILREIFHILLLFLSSLSFLRGGPVKIVAPAVMIFTLSTFMDSISAVLMRLLVNNIPMPVLGNAVQMVLSAALAVLFWRILRLIAARYSFTAQQSISSYLYILLLPCVFVVWVIRFGFGLDNTVLEAEASPVLGSSPLWAFACIFGALATFFVIIQVFAKIVTLSAHETEMALLDSELKEQRLYLAEAKKRDEQYRGFQHDIHNHLLVLSGLLQDGRYAEAQQYFQKLQRSSGALLSSISTGNSVLDILMNEKIRYAEQNQIQVKSVLQLPQKLSIDDIDLCILFSNALDNAITACQPLQKEQKMIQITAKIMHQFLLIEVTNPTDSTEPVRFGTGLRNMKHVAEKYQGTMETAQKDGLFRISLLLCIAEQ